VICVKNFLTAIWIVVCIAVLFIGHKYWNDKTEVKANSDKSDITYTVSNEKKDKIKKSNVKVDKSTELLSLAKNWPETAKSQFQQSLQKKTPFKILFVGSNAIGKDGDGWAQDAAKKLINTYGSKQIKTDILIYDTTSTEFVEKNNQLEIAAANAGLIIFEPFLLNDNGKVEIQNSLDNISRVMADVKETNPTSTFILQPSYPLYGAKYYPLQVEALKKYANDNKITYLDHWTAWPNSSDPRLKDFLLEGQSGPNEKGIEVWEKAVEDYLVSME
jgi:hypothetical protein